MITLTPPIEDDMVDGSRIVKREEQGDIGTLVTTEDGRRWFWHDQSFHVEPGLPLAPAGEWVEYR